MMLGIDLGTTNSLAAVWRDGESVLVPNALGDYLTPSVVSLTEADEVLVGQAARDRLVTHPQHTAAAFKRYMGSDRRIRLGRREFRPEELSALVLRALKQDAEQMLGEPVTEAVISVPAYFNDTQRQATRVAGELAGLKVERLINEPTAAALAYSLHQSEESHFLVFDLGGGTFDVSILELFEGVIEVHASAGDNYLGGEDFVDALVQGFLRRHALAAEQLTPAEHNLLRQQAEQAKRRLNSEPEARLLLRRPDAELDWTVGASEYETLVAPLLQRVRVPVERALRDAGLSVAAIEQIVLVGGSTRKRLVQQMVSRLFGKLPLRHIDPDTVVARGAAVQAGLKARDSALREVVLTDVCPYTLGIEIAHDKVTGLFSPILERNTVVPASRVERYWPVEDYQTGITLRVFQGESRFVRDNIKLGEVEVKVPRKPRDECGVDVRFTYDVNGVLEVEAQVLATGQNYQLLIQQNAGRLSEAEIRERLARLAELKIHPREQAQNQACLARANRLYEERIGDERQYIGALIERFTALLERQDPRQIEQARAELKDILDQFEADTLL